MTSDFGDLLHDIAGEEEAGYAGVADERGDDVGRFVATVRRRRVARRGAVSLVSVGTAAAVALGVVQAWQTFETPPAGSATVGPAPAPTDDGASTPDGESTSVVAPTQFLGECGSRIADVEPLGSAIGGPSAADAPYSGVAPGSMTRLPPADGSTVSSDTSIELDFVTNVDLSQLGGDLSGQWTYEQEVAIVQDGVVVGRSTWSTGRLSFDDVGEFTGRRIWGGRNDYVVGLATDCASPSTGAGAEPLPGGSYEIWAGVQLTAPGSDEPSQRRLELAGTLTLDPTAAPDGPAGFMPAASSAGVPRPSWAALNKYFAACGEPVGDPVSAGSDLVDIGVGLRAPAAAVGVPNAVKISMTNTSDRDLSDEPWDPSSVVLVRDGIVVGHYSTDALTPRTYSALSPTGSFVPGDSTVEEAPVAPVACYPGESWTESGDATEGFWEYAAQPEWLGAGTYQVYVAVQVPGEDAVVYVRAVDLVISG